MTQDRTTRIGGWLGAAAVAVLTLGGAGAATADDAVILKSCKDDLQLSGSACACVLDKVHSELSENQRTFFVAALREDQAAMMSAQMKLTGAEMMEMANFMAITPQHCEAQ